MILADTSAWVEFDRATGSAVGLRMRELIADHGDLATTEPVVMEVVSGARTDAREQDLRRLLARCQLVRLDAAIDFDAAARMYRACRRAGVTPRGLIDCLIASVAHRSDATVLAFDADFSRVADVVGVRLDPASLRAT